MPRRRGLPWLVCLLAAPGVAGAQPAADLTAGSSVEPAAATTAPDVAYGAMPGGLHAISAETLPKGTISILALSGFGRRTGLLGPDHKLNRAVGELAIAYAPLDDLLVGLSLDGRYDRHWGLPVSGDDGYVGDPHLLVRYGRAVGVNHFGAQLGVWVPGKDAPSVAGSAISADLRAVATIAAGPAQLSVDAGFRLDNSVKSVEGGVAGISKLSLQDRVSLGVSEYDAVLAGIHLRIPAGELWVGAEGSLEAFVGSPPAGEAKLAEGSLLVRGAAEVGYHLTDQWALLAYVEVAKDPGIQLAQVMAGAIPIVPYEPVFTGGLGLEAHFGARARVPRYAEKDCHKHVPPDCPAVKVPVTADLSGTVVDDAGKPVIGAKVTLTLKNSKVPGTATDESGTYVFKGVPIGTSIDSHPTIEESGIEVHAEVDGKKPGVATLSAVTPGANKVPPIELEPALPPGELRGLVRTLHTGKPVPGAAITVSPGDQHVVSGSDGTFVLDLPPGQYKITVKAKGFSDQELDMKIDPNGVAIKNIVLHR